MTTMERLNDVFRMVFDDDDIEIRPEMTANDIDGWDSLSHVNLIVAVETTFGIRFNPKEVVSFKDIGDLLNSIQQKIGAA